MTNGNFITQIIAKLLLFFFFFLIEHFFFSNDMKKVKLFTTVLKIVKVCLLKDKMFENFVYF